MLKQWSIAPSAQSIQDALADLPDGDVILFVGGGKNPEQSVAYFHVGYFGTPRRLASVLCGQPGQPGGFAPLPPDAVKVAGIVFYAMRPPPEFSGGRQVSPQLRVVPYSKPVKEITDWNCFCPH